MPYLNRKKSFSVALMAALLSTAPGLAQLTANNNDHHSPVVQRGRNPGLQRIPDCEEAGLCRDRQRLLFPSTNERALERLENRGCKVEHRLEDGVSLSCPNGLGVRGAKPEKAFRAQDIESNQQILVQSAWDAGATGKNVKVVVLDTGVQSNHVELDGRVALTKNFTTGIAGDGQGHGTHVSGTIAGQGLKTIDGTAAIGVAPDASLYVGKVCGDDGWCLEGDILAGMEWAVSVEANVVNMSLGGGSFGTHCDDISLSAKANWMAEQGVVVVAAAGNNGSGVGAPACGSKVIAVGAVDANDSRTTWSSYGEALDVMAPGVSVLSTYSCLAAGSCPGDWYARMSGTSMAAPHVAGAAALLLEKYPALTVPEVYELLTVTADDLGVVGPDIYYGYGRINLAGAFILAEELHAPVEEDESVPDEEEEEKEAEEPKEPEETEKDKSEERRENPGSSRGSSSGSDNAVNNPGAAPSAAGRARAPSNPGGGGGGRGR